MIDQSRTNGESPKTITPQFKPLALATLLASLALAPVGNAALVRWNVSSGSWNTPANWFDNGVPQANDDVLIGDTLPAENGIVHLNINTAINALLINDGLQLQTQDKQLLVAGDISVSGINIIGNIHHPSRIRVGDYGGPVQDPGLRANDITFSDNARFTIEDNGLAEFTGLLNLTTTTQLNTEGTVRLTGAGTVLRNDGFISTGEISLITATNGGLLDLDGSLGNGKIYVTSSSGINDSHGISFIADGLADEFDGEMNIGYTNYLNMSIDGGWTLGNGGHIKLLDGQSSSAKVIGTEITVNGNITSTAGVGFIQADATITSTANIEVGPLVGGTLQFNRRTIVQDGLFTVNENSWLAFSGDDGVQFQNGTFNAINNAYVSISTDTQFAGQNGIVNFTGEVRFRNDVEVTNNSTINAEQLTASYNTPKRWSLTNRDLIINTNTFGDLNNVFSNKIYIENDNLLNYADLEVNLPGNDQWTLGDTLQIVTTTSTARLRGSDVRFIDDVSIKGHALFEARADFVDDIVIIRSESELQLLGGSLNNVNTIDNTNITGGGGTLTVPDGIALEGTGWMLSSFDANFESGSRLIATPTANSNLLNISSPIISMGTLGTRGQNAWLQLNHPYDTALGDHFIMDGGLVTGENIVNTNPTGIRGHGILAARVDNHTVIAAEGGRLIINYNHPEQLIFGTFTDFDGLLTDNGTLHAIAGDMSIVGVPDFLFDGTAHVAGPNEFFFDNSSFQFNPDSHVLMSGGTITSNLTQYFGGDLTTDSQSATLDTNAVFRTGSFTTLNTRLSTQKFMQVHPGADFSGPTQLSRLTNTATGDLLLFDGAEMELNVTSAGLMRIGHPTADLLIGTALIVGNLSLTGTLEIDLGGDTPPFYDLLDIDETLHVRGAIFDVDLVNQFVPMAGDEFNILNFAFFNNEGYQLLLPELSPGLEWDASDFEPIGVIRIAEAIPTPTTGAILILGALASLRRKRR